MTKKGGGVSREEWARAWESDNKGCIKRCIQETRDEIIKTLSDNKGFIDIR